MPSSASVARRIWWFTVSNAADRSRRMRTDEKDDVLAGLELSRKRMDLVVS